MHRGAQETFDISADLQEFAQTPVAVVCAGAKSILDIGLTLEYLETQGVPVIGYQTEELPAFYTRESGFKVDYRLTPRRRSPRRCTEVGAGAGGGAVVANPIPTQFAMPKADIDAAIEQALREADEQGVKGKASTPSCWPGCAS